MSETTKSAEEKREPYELELEEHVKFTYDAEASILTSTKLADLVNEAFKASFPDYAGCKIEMTQTRLSLSLHFKHEVNRRDDLLYAVELSSYKKTQNSTINRTRQRDYFASNGDRYTLTDFGKDTLAPFLFRGYFNNGKPNWGAVVSEISEPTYGGIYAGRSEQFTKISGLDLNRVCEFLFGAKDEDGNPVAYTVDMKGTVGGQNIVGNNAVFILWVNRINVAKLSETYRDLGLGSVSGFVRC